MPYGTIATYYWFLTIQCCFFLLVILSQNTYTVYKPLYCISNSRCLYYCSSLPQKPQCPSRSQTHSLPASFVCLDSVAAFNKCSSVTLPPTYLLSHSAPITYMPYSHIPMFRMGEGSLVIPKHRRHHSVYYPRCVNM